jgi:uncharacterized protein (DUF2461 family)
MSRIDGARERLDAAWAAQERAHRSTGQEWADAARDQYERLVHEPLTNAVQRYQATLSNANVVAERAIALLRQ